MTRFELRRFGRHRLTRAAIAVLTIVPLLYGALYLAAFWDPYANLKRIPVALVQEDTGKVGPELAEKLMDREVFGWIPTSYADAQAGLATGEYQLLLRIPADFSQNVTEAPDPQHTPRKGALMVESDDATNYLSGLLARSAFTEIRAAAAGSVAGEYFERMLIGFSDLKAQTAKAADGAGQLADGTGKAADGAGQLAGGAAKASDGAGTLADGLDSAHHGAVQLSAGLDTLEAGSAQLADGTAKAAAGGAQLQAMVDKAANTAEPLLRKYADEIESAANLIAAGADAIADHIDELPAIADRAVDTTGGIVSKLDAYAAAHPEAADDPAFQAARQQAVQAHELARTLRAKLDGVDELAAKLHTVAEKARSVANAAPHLADDVAHARQQVAQLAAGLNALNQGAQQLHDGTAKAADGARNLSGGLFKLSSGARQLDGGLSTLSQGTKSLAGGLSTLDDGAHKLADGLADGAGKIPGYDADDLAARAGVLGDPVALQRDTHHAAATYGVGFAPYFLALALWVGAMLTYMLMRPLTRRNVVSGASPLRVALAGYLPAAAIGLAQAAVLYLVLRYALGLVPVSPLGTMGLLALTALAFNAILQMLGALLGPPGRLVALLILMLQLTSSGGTYPVETSPGFFQVLHPWLPMTYVIAGLRRTTVGGSWEPVWLAVAVLAGVAMGALALTTLAARRARRLTPRDLYPVLSM